MSDLIYNVSIIGGLIIAVTIQLILFIYFQKKKYGKLQDNLISNTMQLLQKMEDLELKIENKEGGNMDENLKTVAKYLSQRINDSSDRIIGEIKDLSDKIDEMTEVEPEEEPEEEKGATEEGKEDEFSELEDYEGERKISFDEALEEIDGDKGKEKKKKKKK